VRFSIGCPSKKKAPPLSGRRETNNKLNNTLVYVRIDASIHTAFKINNFFCQARFGTG
jgi:hypothetical protein